MTKDSAVLHSARQFGLAWACGILLAIVMVVLAVWKHLPVRDPDGNFLWFPLILLAAIVVDVAPRVAHRSRLRGSWSRADVGDVTREVMRERWHKRQWAYALSGLGAWYLCYATFRNVKSMVPFVNHRLYDDRLAAFDRKIWFGHAPAVVLHHVFGTGIFAHIFSGAYILWIGLVPASIAIALVWTRATSAGSWYVTAVALDWVLGALFYLLVPTLGPIYSSPEHFTALPHTYVTDLESGLLTDYTAVTQHPWGAGRLQTIAAFPSLHVGIMTTICLTVTLLGLRRWIRVVAWIFWVVTVFGTMYLGWHFFADILGGIVVGSFAVWASAMTTGNHVGLRPRLRYGFTGERRPEEEPQPDPATSSGARPARLS
ncbi:MAG: phosphatase PAP2 family protein [Nocardioidaceae bacterium]|nr:phosphatase PAP2 family protein [Nocardioidaceae bacterium]MCL2614401.1 phosphatase PAP2 family protein [Nocardioidaceae bacterium]